MSWYLIDDCTIRRGVIWTEELDAETKGEAKAYALNEWSRLTTHDKHERDYFYIGFGHDPYDLNDVEFIKS